MGRLGEGEKMRKQDGARVGYNVLS